MKMEAVDSYKISVNFHRYTWHHILYNHRCEDLTLFWEAIGLLAVHFLLVPCFDHEDGGNTFLRNTSKLLQAYTTPHCTKSYFSHGCNNVKPNMKIENWLLNHLLVQN
jgi:hypothetical protein